jgi:hypothetical protein
MHTSLPLPIPLLAVASLSLTVTNESAFAGSESRGVPQPQRWTVVSSAETSDEELSNLTADRRRAARGLPIELDVQLVKSRRGGRDLQVIGVSESDVWVVELDRKVAQVRKIGKVFVPDPALLERIARSLAGARVVIAFNDLEQNTGAGSLQQQASGTDHESNHSGVSANPTVLVTADESLYRVRLDSEMQPAVQRLGALKKAYSSP